MKTIVPTIQKVLETDPKVRLVFKEFPILGPSSELAARAGLAVWRLEPAKYERFHFTLMQTRGQLPEAEIMTIASKLGINPKKLSQEMKGPYVKKAIEKNIALAKSLDIRGTPNFIIGNELVRGAIDFSTIKRLIAKARKG